MSSNLGSFFRQERLRKGLSLGQLARLVGYKNLSSGSNRIHRCERTGIIHQDLLVKIALVLDIDSKTIDQLFDLDRRRLFSEWLSFANEPITPYVVVRLIPAVYMHCPLPDEICSVEAAEEYASQLSRAKRKRCCLVLSRRYSVWFDEKGKVECRTEAVPGQPNSPYMRTRRGRPFLLRSVSNQEIIEALKWPWRT